MAYTDEDLIRISGIQKYLYCPRQWALSNVEWQWEDNYLTEGGNRVHKRAHDSDLHEKRGNLIVTRGLAVRSYEIGIIGKCDVVEFKKDESGVFLPQYGDYFKIEPVEYKRGIEKLEEYDRAQTVAQVMCLEEMLCCEIPSFSIYYASQHKREEYEMTEELRSLVRKSFSEMHVLAERGYTPKVKKSKKCNNCSLKNICLPEMFKTMNAKQYILRNLEEQE